MRNGLLLMLLGWIIAWLETGWLVWLAFVIVLLLLVAKLVPLNPLGLILMAVLLVLMKSYAMAQQQRQMPIYLHGQQSLLAGCYLVEDVHAFPLSLKISDFSLFRPGLGQTFKQVRHWRPEKNLANDYVQVSVYDKLAIQQLTAQPVGQLQALVQLRKLRNYGNPSGFDYVSWSRHQGLLGRGYVKQLLAISDTSQKCKLVTNPLQGLRNILQSYLLALPINESAKKLWQALALGQSNALSNTDWQVVNRTGTTHLLIISGLHIGLLASLVLLQWKWVQPYTKVPYWHPLPLLVAWVIALAYALLSGWGLPAQRAMIMISLVLLGGWRGIVWPLEQRLIWAAILTLVVQPVSLYQSGFWFSYLAVANLALIWRQQQRPDALALKDWWRANWLAQVSLLAMLTPIIAYVTGGLSILAPLLNLFLIPLFTLLVVPWVLIMSLFMLLLDSENWLLIITGEGLNAIWQGLSYLSSTAWGYWHTSHWPVAIWVIWFLCGLILLVATRLIWLPLMALGLLLWAAPAKPLKKLTVMDVGQGLAVWLQAGDQHLLYDLGDRFRSGFNLLEAVVLPQLRSAGVDQLQQVVVSHWDRDHSGGISALQRQGDISVRYWLYPSQPRPKLEALLNLNNTTMQRCETASWQAFGDMKVRTINLLGRGFQNNNASCVLQIEYAGKRILLTGDIERLAETKLWQTHASELASDVMLAPHHGSQTSSSQAFLDYVQPRLSVISAGFDNRFNHPHQGVLQRYWQNDVYWLNTAIHGQIELLMDNGGWHLKTHRYD
jgi:competence protein ComEC